MPVRPPRLALSWLLATVCLSFGAYCVPDPVAADQAGAAGCQDFLSKLEKQPGVKAAVPFIEAQGAAISSLGGKVVTARVRGVTAVGLRELLSRSLIEKTVQFEQFGEGGWAAVGMTLGSAVHVKLGDEIHILIPLGRRIFGRESSSYEKVRISATFQAEPGGQEPLIFVDGPTAEKLFETRRVKEKIAVTLSSPGISTDPLSAFASSCGHLLEFGW